MSLQASLIPLQTPLSTIFVLLLAILLTAVTSVANRLLTNREQMASWRKTISEWQEEFNQARKSGDKKLLEKAMKKQKQVMQIQSKMFTQQMKVTLIFIVPFFLFWTWLNSVGFNFNGPAGKPDHVVALLPGFLGSGGLTVFYWYLICSLALGALFAHLLGIGTMGGTDE
ncbi:MAG TPA: EMC3/TMCO1 family protein [Candidatus Bathyarchaeia archaeon]|nr:EMC3/TMCO1 family protein [Candidatus Bathyarchaeia archaeon]